MKKIEYTLFDSFPTTIENEDNECAILYVSKIETPLGCMVGVADDHYLYLLEFADGNKVSLRIDNIKVKTSSELLLKDNALLINLKQEIGDYFGGNLKKFTIPVKYFGTDFQKESWSELSKVKFGETLSYSQLASRLGKTPAHSRAVGACAGANPLVLIVPCHRLIAAHGKQGGFSAGGDRKTFLLNHEKKFK